MYDRNTPAEQKLPFIAIALLICALFAPPPAKAAEASTLIAAGSFRWLPYFDLNHDTGKITGAMYDILQEACRRADAEVVFTSLPWRRVLDNAKHGEIDIICGLYRTSARAEYLDFSIPLLRDEIRVFTTGELPINSYEDLVGLRGTAVLGSSYGEEFDAFAAKHLRLTRLIDIINFFRKTA